MNYKLKTIKYYLLISGISVLGIVFLFTSLQCCRHDANKGELLFYEADSLKGFNFPYFVFIPDGVRQTDTLVFIVEPNNTGFVSDNFKQHIDKAKRTASLDFYMGNYISRALGFPLLVPVFPRSESEWKIYTHALDRDVVIQKGNALQYMDQQLLAMVDDARNRLHSRGFNLKEKILMTGFSASGTFINRFALIHPQKLIAVAAGGLNGLLILPMDSLENEAINYPIGTHDFDSLFGSPLLIEAFKATPQFLFMGSLDTNDAIPYEDAFDKDEREQIFRLLGKEMQPLRWEKCKALYRKRGINATFKTYKNIGHEHPEEIKDDVVTFFKQQLD